MLLLVIAKYVAVALIAARCFEWLWHRGGNTHGGKAAACEAYWRTIYIMGVLMVPVPSLILCLVLLATGLTQHYLIQINPSIPVGPTMILKSAPTVLKSVITRFRTP
jgi:hypothetical protein